MLFNTSGGMIFSMPFLVVQRSMRLIPSHDVRVHMCAIRKEKKKEDVVRLALRVKIMLSIIKKL